jgi:hypothetical protein
LYYRPKRNGKTLDQGAWEQSYEPSLAAHRDFAVSRGKPVAYSEWAVGGVDEPAFIERMHTWMLSLPGSGGGSLLYHSYFNATNPEYNLDYYPRQKQRYIDLFGGNGGAAQPVPPAIEPPVTTTTPPPPETTAPPVSTTTPPPVPPTTTPEAAEGPVNNLPRRITAPLNEPVVIDLETTGTEVIWWKLRGPGPVTWEDKQVEDPTVIFRARGNYVLTVKTTRNGISTRSYITVAVGRS